MFDANPAPSDTAAAPSLPAMRLTVAEVEAKRNLALTQHGLAFDALAAAVAASSAATNGTTDGQLSAHATLTGKHYLASGEQPKPAYMEHVRRGLDRAIWSYVVDYYGLEKLMDRTEAETFRKGLEENPTPFTSENCEATFRRLIGDANAIFSRGIALAFSGLDRRFRSHDGFKIGSRIVIAYALDSFGSWVRGREDTIRDVERAFYVVDGGEQPDRMGGIIGALRTARGNGYGAKAYMAETDYFRVRVFMNGNAHIWFKRDDLVAKVNKLLGDYYGETLGAGPDAAETTVQNKTGIAPRFGLFETPEALALRLISEASISTPATFHETESRRYDRLKVLEPSAGRGRIALPMARAGHDVTCVELQPALAEGLRRDGLRVVCADFMEVTPEPHFDRVVMNPPFDRGRDCDHVRHAFKFLKPGGVLVAVMSARTEFAEDRRTVEFRAFVERHKGDYRDLPPGSFAESGTNTNTLFVTIRAPRAA